MKILKKFEFVSGSDRSSYEWDKILSGQPVQLDAGTDYECKDVTMATLARSAARKRGMTIRTAKVEGGMVVQAFPASKEQLQDWDKQDKERADKKAADKTAESTEE